MWVKVNNMLLSVTGFSVTQVGRNYIVTATTTGAIGDVAIYKGTRLNCDAIFNSLARDTNAIDIAGLLYD